MISQVNMNVIQMYSNKNTGIFYIKCSKINTLPHIDNIRRIENYE